MATTIEELAVRFSAQTEDLTRELRRLESSAARTGKRVTKKIGGIQNSLNSVAKAAKAAGGALIAAFAAREVVSSINSVFNEMSELVRISDSLSVSVETIQEFRFSMVKLGGDAEKVTDIFKDFQERVGEARQGTGEFTEFMKLTGVTLKDNEGNLKSVEMLLSEVVDILADTTDGADRANLANRAFGGSWEELLPLLAKGSEELKKLRKEARDTGAVISEDMVRSAAEADQKLNALATTISTKLKVAFLGFLQVVGAIDTSEMQKLSEQVLMLDKRLENLNQRRQNLESGGFSAIGEAGIFEKGQKDRLQQINVQIKETTKNMFTLLGQIQELRKPQDVKSRSFIDTAAADEAAKELKKISDKVASDLENLRNEVFKINNDIFAVINETARLELQAFKKTFEGKVGFENQFLEAKKLIEEKRVAATVEAQRKIDEAATLAQEKLLKEKMSRDKKAATEAQRIMDENMRIAQAHAAEFSFVFQNSFDELIFQGGKLSDVLKNLLRDLARVAIHSAILGPLAASLGSKAAGVFGFAGGGVMTSGGAAPLRSYASGGVATSPQLALFGEGSRPEAFVPLPDGRNIPVKLQGNGGAGSPQTVVNNFTFMTDVKNTVRAELLNAVPLIIEASVERMNAQQLGIR